MSSEEPPTAPASLPKYLREGLPKQDRETLLETHEYIDELLEWTQQPIEDDELPDDADPVDEDGSSSKGGTVVMDPTKSGVAGRRNHLSSSKFLRCYQRR